MFALLLVACFINHVIVALSESSDFKCCNESRLPQQLDESTEIKSEMTHQPEMCSRQKDGHISGGKSEINVTTLLANRTNPPQLESTISPQSVYELDLTQPGMVTTMSTSARMSTSSTYWVSEDASCKGKCGQMKGMPCSCDLKCLVHKNCCEDMDIACPEVLEESRFRYGHMLDMKVECSQENIFVITECRSMPETAKSPQDDKNRPITNPVLPLNSPPQTFAATESPQTFTAKKDFHSSDQTRKTNSTNVRHFLSNPYVTDAATGFVYKNMDVYSCAARDNSRPLLWGSALLSLSGYDDTNLRSVLRAICGGKMRYVPPEGVNNNLTGAQCYFGARNCRDETQQRDLSFLTQCQQFISYTHELENVVFQNRYCAMCENIASGTRPKLFTIVRIIEIRANMTQSSKSLRIFRENKYNTWAWLEATCNSSETDSNELCSQDVQCEIEQCSPHTLMRPDGNCKFLHYLTLAVSDDDNPLSQEEHNAFPEFARCFIKSHVGLDIDDDLSPTEVLFDERVNGNLYVTKLYVYDTHSDLTDLFIKPTDTAQMNRLFLMSKTFKNYRRSKVNESSAHKKIVTKTKTIYSHNFRDYISNNQEPLNNKADVTTTCMCSMLNVYPTRLDSLHCPLACAQDPMFVGDKEAVAAYLNSTCFSVFDKSLNVGSLMTMSGPALLMLLVMRYLL